MLWRTKADDQAQRLNHLSRTYDTDYWRENSVFRAGKSVVFQGWIQAPVTGRTLLARVKHSDLAIQSNGGTGYPGDALLQADFVDRVTDRGVI